MTESNPSARHYAAALAAEEAGAVDSAIFHFGEACKYINRYPPALQALKRHAANAYAQATAHNTDTDPATQIGLLVQSLQWDPENTEVRALLEQKIESRGVPDLTRHCSVYRDAARAEAISREAIRRCMDYVSIAGVAGEIMDFGVLAGWSARIFAETARDLMYLCELHLFDSFEGLPAEYSDIDQTSYEIGSRDIWPEKMRFPEEYREPYGGNIERHVVDRLSTVVSGDRIHLHKGYYAQTLKEKLDRKAALVHIDCDLYQSTIEVLDGLHQLDAFQDGCVLMFDDWNCNKASPHFGERRAFAEFLNKHAGRYESCPFFTYGFNGAVFFLHGP